MMSRFTSSLLFLTLFAVLAVTAPAKGSFVREMQKKYPDTKVLKNFQPCALCHVDVKKKAGNLTAFGKDFKAAKAKTPAEKFAAIEKLYSDKDKFTNLEEIKAGSNPADPKSTPKEIRPMMSDAKTSTTAGTTVAPMAPMAAHATDAKTSGTAAQPTAQKAARKAGARKTRKKRTPRTNVQPGVQPGAQQ